MEVLITANGKTFPVYVVGVFKCAGEWEIAFREELESFVTSLPLDQITRIEIKNK